MDVEVDSGDEIVAGKRGGKAVPERRGNWRIRRKKKEINQGSSFFWSKWMKNEMLDLIAFLWHEWDLDPFFLSQDSISGYFTRPKV